jgi:hypothetical protein
MPTLYQDSIQLPPRCAARFRVERTLGTGGFATVYLANQISLDRPVALKVLRSELAQDANAVHRFRREATITAGIQHPNIVKTIDHDVEENLSWIAFEYVPQESLRERLRLQRILSPRDALIMVRQVAAGLAAAHALGVCHRDVKPENIFCLDRELYKIGDFGAARTDVASTFQTEAGLILGTAAYLAPEVIAGEPAGPAADVYALGITLYECLVGETPFTGTRLTEVLEAHQRRCAPSPSSLRPDLSPALDDLVLRALEKDPTKRIGSAEAFRVAAASLLETLPEAPGLTTRLIPLDARSVGSAKGTQTTVQVERSPQARPTTRQVGLIVAVILAIGSGWGLYHPVDGPVSRAETLIHDYYQWMGRSSPALSSLAAGEPCTGLPEIIKEENDRSRQLSALVGEFRSMRLESHGSLLSWCWFMQARCVHLMSRIRLGRWEAFARQRSRGPAYLIPVPDSLLAEVDELRSPLVALTRRCLGEDVALVPSLLGRSRELGGVLRGEGALQEWHYPEVSKVLTRWRQDLAGLTGPPSVSALGQVVWDERDSRIERISDGLLSAAIQEVQQLAKKKPGLTDWAERATLAFCGRALDSWARVISPALVEFENMCASTLDKHSTTAYAETVDQLSGVLAGFPIWDGYLKPIRSQPIAGRWFVDLRWANFVARVRLRQLQLVLQSRQRGIDTPNALIRRIAAATPSIAAEPDVRRAAQGFAEAVSLQYQHPADPFSWPTTVAALRQLMILQPAIPRSANPSIDVYQLAAFLEKEMAGKKVPPNAMDLRAFANAIRASSSAGQYFLTDVTGLRQLGQEMERIFRLDPGLPAANIEARYVVYYCVFEAVNDRVSLRGDALRRAWQITDMSVSDLESLITKSRSDATILNYLDKLMAEFGIPADERPPPSEQTRRVRTRRHVSAKTALAGARFINWMGEARLAMLLEELRREPEARRELVMAGMASAPLIPLPRAGLMALKAWQRCTAEWTRCLEDGFSLGEIDQIFNITLKIAHLLEGDHIIFAPTDLYREATTDFQSQLADGPNEAARLVAGAIRLLWDMGRRGRSMVPTEAELRRLFLAIGPIGISPERRHVVCTALATYV